MPYADKEKRKESNKAWYDKKRRIDGANNSSQVNLFAGQFVRTDACPITGLKIVNEGFGGGVGATYKIKLKNH